MNDVKNCNSFNSRAWFDNKSSTESSPEIECQPHMGDDGEFSIAQEDASALFAMIEKSEKLKSMQAVLKQLEIDFDAVGKTSSVSSLVEGSLSASDLATNGRNVLSGINNINIDSLEKFVPLDLFTSGAHLATNAGTVTTLAIQLGALIINSQEWQRLQTLFAEKNAELLQLSQDTRVNSDEVANRKKQLLREMDEIKQQAIKISETTTHALLSSSVAFSSDALGTASIISSLVSASEISNILSMASGAVAVVGSLVTGGIATNNLCQAGQEIKAINNERSRLSEKLKETNLDSTVKEVIQMRLLALEQMYSDTLISIVKESLTLSFATVGGSATGAAIGLSLMGMAGLASTIVIGTGVGAGVLGAGLLATGLGYAAYKNKKVIALKVDQLSQTSQSQAKKLRIRHEKSLLNCAQDYTQKTQNEIKKILEKTQKHKQTLEKKLDSHYSLINQYAAKRAEPTTTAAHAKELDLLLEKEFKASKKIYAKIDLLNNKAALLVDQKTSQLAELCQSTNNIFKKIEDFNIELAQGEEEAKLLQFKSTIESLSLKFPNTTPEKLKMTIASWMKTLHESSLSKSAMKSFIFGEGFISTEFDDNPIAQLMTYLTREAQQQKAA